MNDRERRVADFTPSLPHPLTPSPPQSVRVGVCAPVEVTSKIAYALEELLAAAGVPSRVEMTDTREGWDLFYGDDPPEDGGLWMAASAEAWRFFAKPGCKVESVITVRVAGKWLRLPDFVMGVHALPDLAAAAFFFLSRWEEWRAPEQDRFGRFPLSASVFGRGLWSLTECPVEAYAQALRHALEDAPRTARLSGSDVPVRESRVLAAERTAAGAGPRGRSGVHGGGNGTAGELSAGDQRPMFLLGLSHDVDSLRRWDARGFGRAGREMARALLSGRIRAAARPMRDLVAGMQSRASGQDPHENLEEIVRLECDAGSRSSFFLLARHTHPWDGTHAAYYQRRLTSLARSLASEAEVGLHAGTAAVDTASLREERERLMALTGAAVHGLRYHNLRGGYAALPEVAAAGFEYESSLGFAEEPGFPAGIARPFRPYDRERDCPLDLVEIPLALMDTTLLSPRYLGLDVRAGRQRALLALEPLRRWGGAAALLWHNGTLPPNHAAGYAALYPELIEWTRAAGGQVATLAEIADGWRQNRAALTGMRDEG